MNKIIDFIKSIFPSVSEFLSNFFRTSEHIIYWGDNMIDSNSLIAYGVGILIVVAVCFIFTKPIKWILKLVLNGVLGGIMLLIINAVGKGIGLFIPINPINALVTGILGFPGVILLVLINLIL